MVLIALGIIPFVIGCYVLTCEISNRIRCTGTVEGKVVNRVVKVEFGLRFDVRTNYYYPVYEYEVNGRKYFGTTKQCSRDENWYKPGDTSKISYNPDNPEIIVSKNYYGELLYGGVFALAGIILMIIGMIHL